MNIQANLLSIKNQIIAHEVKYGREQGSVRLLAASKGHSIEQISEALAGGQTIFGENYLQEALPKIAALRGNNIEWHFIGPIQSNKTRKIAEHFAWVEGVDDMKIAKRLSDQRPVNLPPLNICIEVNVSAQTTKSGIHINEATALANYCMTLPRLHLRGLMTIPTPHDDMNSQREEFHKLLTLYETLRANGMLLDTLSMGMSGDFEAAIAEGSTLVRIGTAIFGQR